MGAGAAANPVLGAAQPALIAVVLGGDRLLDMCRTVVVGSTGAY